MPGFFLFYIASGCGGYSDDENWVGCLLLHFGMHASGYAD